MGGKDIRPFRPLPPSYLARVDGQIDPTWHADRSHQSNPRVFLFKEQYYFTALVKLWCKFIWSFSLKIIGKFGSTARQRETADGVNMTRVTNPALATAWQQPCCYVSHVSLPHVFQRCRHVQGCHTHIAVWFISLCFILWCVLYLSISVCLRCVPIIN